jgi:outer membrane protein
MNQAVFRLDSMAVLLGALLVFAALPADAKASKPSVVTPRPAAVVSAGAPVLDLAEAASMARNNSLSVRTNQERLLSANLQRQLTVDGSWPTLGFQTNASYNQLPADSPLVTFLSAPGGGGLVGFPAPGVTVDTSVHASQVLFDGFRLRDSLIVADDQIALGRLGIARAEEDAMTNAAVAYFGVLRAQGISDVATTSVHQAEEHLRLGGERLKAGSGTRADVLTLQAQLATSRGALIQARNAVSLARLLLDKALNAPVGSRPLAATAGVSELGIDLEDEVAHGLPRRPEVQQQLLKVHLDDARASYASRGYWPTLQGQVGYIQRGLYQGNFSTGVVLSWDAFDGFKTREQIALAQAEGATDALTLEQTRQDLELDVRTQAQARQEARDRIAIAREGLTAADEAYRISIQRYELGFSTSTELLDARTTLAQSRNTYIQATHDLNVAQIRLAKALGVDMAAYLGASR